MATGEKWQTLQRVAWFIGLWAAGVITVAVIGLLIRSVLDQS